MSASDWEVHRLGHLLGDKGYVRGPFGSSLKRGEMSPTGIPVYEQQHAIYNSREFRFYIDEMKFRELKRFQVKTNDLIVSCSGTIGKISIISKDDPKGIISQALLILRPDHTKVLPKYLQYYFSTREGFNNLVSTSHGSVQINIAGRDVVESIEIKLPPPSTQARIVDILSSLDDKVELNRRTNATLEAIAQAIFKEWFVEFRFPGSIGELVESELGMIPKGWRVGKLGEMYKTTSGGTPSRLQDEYYENGIYQWVKSKELNGSFIIDTEERITDDALRVSSAKLIPRHSVLVAMYGATVGEIGIISNEATTNQAICAFIPNDSNPFTFVFQFLQKNKDDIISRAVGSAQQNISQELLKNLVLAIPDNHTMKGYHAIVEPIFSTIEDNLKQSASLTKVRDNLLPKLMGGEIEV